MSARRVRVPSLLGDPGVARACTPSRRFLFAVPPLAGHVAAVAAVAAELARRDHKVAWTGHRASLEPLLRPRSRIFSALADEDAARLRDDRLRTRGPADPTFWEEFLVPLGHAMLPGVETAVDRFRPDVVVGDQFVLAAPVAARRREIPWATSAATPAEFTRPLADRPDDERRVRERIGGFQLDHGIDDLLDLRFSDHLVLVFSTGALLGDVSFFPDHFAFVGPVLGRPAPSAFPWDRLDGRPAVLVSLGTADPSHERFFRVAAEAVRELDVQAVFAAPPGTVGDVPPNVLVRRQVPRPKLLERMSAVVCDGGYGAVCESLAHGLPLVAAPIRDDQPIIARLVERAGAGTAVPFDGVRPDELRTALATVLADGPHRAAAGRVRDSFAAAGGAAEAADRLEKLA
ncbi:glycosyltransferase [Actinomadura citrea]|uniref:MGT family glycosyltransferase n=1 Tax=Actinomadura citrea TaxID=46158 RepID=A0A7Y9GFY7_9ACTN|nr:nucleotide disphospho-sugar-binding domain-containing protein [Actinomadura citrea]NYE15778.1 MGT family glycosyltransferase [Actinomadura citrea]GGT67062.1 glycosyl transferase [Actinomadura citrea]